MGERTLRVLHVVSTNERRGAEMFVADLIRVMDEAGIEERVAVMRDAGDPPAPFGEATALTGPNGGLLPFLGVNVRTGLALRTLIRTWQPQVVMAHGGEALKYAVPSRGGAKLVYRRVGATPAWMAGPARRRVYSALMRRADLTIAVAEATRQEATGAFGLDPRRTIAIPNAVDRERVTATRGRTAVRAELGIGTDAPVVLFVGALNDEKDPRAALAVVRPAMGSNPDTVLVMVGDGPFRGDVEAGARAAGIAGRVLILGARSDVGDLMAASDVLLLTSRTEGMPGCVIEAGMAGLPVVGYAIGGVPEVVIDGRTGSLAAPGDERALADLLVTMLGDAASRRAMGESGRARCRSMFDVRASRRSTRRCTGSPAGVGAARRRIGRAVTVAMDRTRTRNTGPTSAAWTRAAVRVRDHPDVEPGTVPGRVPPQRDRPGVPTDTARGDRGRRRLVGRHRRARAGGHCHRTVPRPST